MHVHAEVMYASADGNVHSDLCAEGTEVRKEGDYRKMLHAALDEALDNMTNGNASCFFVFNDKGEEYMPEYD